MNKIILTSVLFLFAVMTLKSQDPEFEYYKDKEIKTLLGRDRAGGFFGAITLGYSQIDNQNAVILGGRFSWIASHNLGIGIGGTGFINEYHYEPHLGSDVFLTGGYGGIYLEPILFPRFPVHMAFPVLLGAGGISYISNDEALNSNFIEDSEAFLLIEPCAEVELNLTKHFRLTFGATYRFPTPFNVGLEGSPLVSSKSLKGFSYEVSFKFGRF
jgi:hypothetical protein